MSERQKFKLLRTFEGFELREYLPCVMAEVRVSAEYSTASSSAFSALFNYISQGNKSSQKIAMTAPVITAQKEDNSQSTDWYVSFVMPSGRTIGHMPHPNDSKIELRELEAETCVAKSFRGRATEELSGRIVKELRASASSAGIALSDETRICRFDPPFNPGFLQYNEIVIPAYLEAF
jgi:SOUL heme-binding protein